MVSVAVPNPIIPSGSISASRSRRPQDFPPPLKLPLHPRVEVRQDRPVRLAQPRNRSERRVTSTALTPDETPRPRTCKASPQLAAEGGVWTF